MNATEETRIDLARANMKKWMAAGVIGYKALFRIAKSHGLSEAEADALVKEVKQS